MASKNCLVKFFNFGIQFKIFLIIFMLGLGLGDNYSNDNCVRYSEKNKSVCRICKPGFFIENGKCFDCGVNCKSCTSKDRCVSCWDGYGLNSKKDSCYNLKLKYLKLAFILSLIFLSLLVLIISFIKLRHINQQTEVNDIILGKKNDDNNTPDDENEEKEEPNNFESELEITKRNFDNLENLQEINEIK